MLAMSLRKSTSLLRFLSSFSLVTGIVPKGGIAGGLGGGRSRESCDVDSDEESDDCDEVSDVGGLCRFLVTAPRAPSLLALTSPETHHFGSSQTVTLSANSSLLTRILITSMDGMTCCHACDLSTMLRNLK